MLNLVFQYSGQPRVLNSCRHSTGLKQDAAVSRAAPCSLWLALQDRKTKRILPPNYKINRFRIFIKTHIKADTMPNIS